MDVTGPEPPTWRQILALHPPALYAHPDGRRAVTRLHPLRFALVYLRHHLTDSQGRVSLSRMHHDMAHKVRRWSLRDVPPAAIRDAWVAPRGSGKSTWQFLILPLWALAHGHRRFVAAFADSGPQAEQHLSTLKMELDNNPLLRFDYPALCTPQRRLSGATVADSQGLYIAAGGAAFMAKGIDSSTLGAKVGAQRPDLLLFDDVEPDASNYSPYQKQKRLKTIVNAVFPMDLTAAVSIAGTVTMDGSIVHDIVRHGTEPHTEHTPTWPGDEKIRCNYYPPLWKHPTTGQPVSLWPQKWTADYLTSIAHTRSFAMNFANRPLGTDGWWSDDHFIRDKLTAPSIRILSVDPATTTKGSSDYTGIAVVRCQRSQRRFDVPYAAQVKLRGRQLTNRMHQLIGEYDITVVLVETNQGGDLWTDEDGVFAGLTRRVLTVHQSEPKQVRFERLLHEYEMRRIYHPRPLHDLERAMLAYPNVVNDDIIDAVSTPITHIKAEWAKEDANAGTSSGPTVGNYSRR